MSRIAKLFAKLIEGRPLSFAEFERLLTAFGFQHVRTQGSHRIYAREDIPDQLSVQPRGKDAKPYQLRQFSTIVTQYDLTLDDSQ